MPHMRIGDIVHKVNADFNINISRNEAQNTKKIATKMIEGDYNEKYSCLYDYCNELIRANPGLNVFMRTIENERWR